MFYLFIFFLGTKLQVQVIEVGKNQIRNLCDVFHHHRLSLIHFFDGFSTVAFDQLVGNEKAYIYPKVYLFTASPAAAGGNIVFQCVIRRKFLTDRHLPSVLFLSAGGQVRIHDFHTAKTRYQTYWLRDEAANCVKEVGILNHVNAQRRLTMAEVG